MSDDSEDPPLVFPTSDTEKNCDDSTSDAEPVTSTKWTPECLQLLLDHGIDPDNLEDGEEFEDEEEEDKPENKAHGPLKFRLPPPKAGLKAGGEKLQLVDSAKKRKKGTDKNEATEDEDEGARRARKKRKKARLGNLNVMVQCKPFTYLVK